MSATGGWDRIETLLDELFDLPESERDAYLDRHTEGEPALRKAVEALLAADTRPVDFLDRGADEYARPMFAEADTELLAGPESGKPTLDAGGPKQHTEKDNEAPMPESIAQYRILGKLGEGGMGIVYEAEQANPRRRVALKVVRGGRFVDDASVRMFQREVDVLARLRHPNIAGIYESGQTDDGLPYFAMELVTGETLDVHLARFEGELDADELDRRLRLFRSIADAVHYAHQRGVIHRDLKPANIIVTERGLESDSQSSSSSSSSSTSGLPETKILDFGLARITEGDSDHGLTVASRTGIIKGTLPYMSPEQTRGSPGDLDLRSDVYALGVILFEMLTGERPCDTRDKPLAEALRVITEVPPKPLRQAWKGAVRLDPDLATIVGKALEKKRDDRYGSAAAFSEDIERLRTNQPILARPPSAMYQLRKLVSRNRLASGFVAAIATLVLFFGVFMSVLWRQSEAERARAEASLIVAQGRAQLDRSPSTALAYAIASLRLSDTREGRELAVEGLSRGPTAQVVTPTPSHGAVFSADGALLSLSRLNEDLQRGEQATWDARGGEPRWMTELKGKVLFAAFDPAGSRVMVHLEGEDELRSLGLSSLRQAPPLEVGARPDMMATSDGSTLLSFRSTEGNRTLIRIWDSETQELIRSGVVPGNAAMRPDEHQNRYGIDRSGSRIAYFDREAGDLYVRSLLDLTAAPEVLGRHPSAHSTTFHPTEPLIVSAEWQHGELCFWQLERFNETPARCVSNGEISAAPSFDPTGRYLAAGNSAGVVWVWDLHAPPDAAPTELRKQDQASVHDVVFHPDLPLLVASDNGNTVMWDLRQEASLRFTGHGVPARGLGFDPEGRWLYSVAAIDSELFQWSLDGTRSAINARLLGQDVIASPDGQTIITSHSDGGVYILRRPDSSTPLAEVEPEVWRVRDVRTAALRHDGQWLAVGGGVFFVESTVIQMRNLATGETVVLDPQDEIQQTDLLFLRDGRLAATGPFGVRLWNPKDGTFVSLDDVPSGVLAATPDDRFLFWSVGPGIQGEDGGSVRRMDLNSGAVTEMTSHGEHVRALTVSADGRSLITGSLDGTVRVGPIDGSEPHLLFGHRGGVTAVAADPKGRWIASAGFDTEVRLWPVPTGAPLHTLPRAELLELLESRTNYRVDLSDGLSALSLEVEPFPGWVEAEGGSN